MANVKSNKQTQVEKINDKVSFIILQHEELFSNIDTEYQDNYLVFYLRNINKKDYSTSMEVVSQINKLNNKRVTADFFPVAQSVVVSIDQSI